MSPEQRARTTEEVQTETLPNYAAPPVIEVVCSVQFKSLGAFTSIHFGKFLAWVTDSYPQTEDRTPVADLFEGRPVLQVPETFDVPPLRRVFYIDSSGNFLLQLQPTRFMANWRKLREEDRYPRFDEVERRFLEGWDVFLRFAADQELGTPQANQYELTYINHIVALDDQEEFPAATERFMPWFSWTSCRSLGFLPPPSGLGMRLRFDLPDKRGVLHLKLEHGRRQTDGKDVLLVEFTARGPAEPDWSNMRSWFSTAHEWIVKGFTDLTSTQAHVRWGRVQ